MAFDEYQADRIRTLFKELRVPDFYEKKMMGGLCFMVDDKMCCGVHFSKKQNTDLLMLKIGQESALKFKNREGCLPMDFTGRPMKDFVFVTPDGYDIDEDLQFWIELALAFNPFAKASRKRTKKS